MTFPTTEQVERVRAEYPPGTRVRIVHMDDPQAPPIGTEGEVMFVDDTASIHVRWQNGSGLALIYGEDYAERIE